MTKHSGDSRALLRLAGSIPVVLLLLACFSFTSQATEIRTDPPNGQNDSDIEIVSVGTIRKAPDTQERYRKAKGERTSISSPKRCRFSKARERCEISSIGSTPVRPNTTTAVKLSSRSSSKRTAPSPRYRFSILPIPLWAKPLHASSHRHRHGRPARSTGNRSAYVIRCPSGAANKSQRTKPTTGEKRSENGVVVKVRNADFKASEALIFIDDKEATQTDMEKIDPDKIERISVYRDSSAVVRYGERGKNGVILIKMKQ